jgi:hypothetical protein
MALRQGNKSVIIAVVDAGTVSFFKFGQGAFEEWPMAAWLSSGGGDSLLVYLIGEHAHDLSPTNCELEYWGENVSTVQIIP